MKHVVGHTAQRERLARLVHNGKLPPAVLLAGPVGVGKFLVAQELAQQILCETHSRCGSCQPCTLLACGNNPDLHLIACNESGVDDMRQVLHTLQLRAFLGGARVVVLRDADELNVHSANALLKSLEEPRPDTFYLLTAANPSRLPSTILSRCQIWFLDTLSADDMRAILGTQQHEVPLEELVLLADGSLQHLDAASANLPLWQEVQDALRRIASGDALAVQRAVDAIVGGKDTLRLGLQLARACARQQMRESRDPEAQRRWATTLQDLLAAEPLLFERHLAPQNLLPVLFRRLLPSNHPQHESITARIRG